MLAALGALPIVMIMVAVTAMVVFLTEHLQHGDRRGLPADHRWRHHRYGCRGLLVVPVALAAT